MKFDKLNIPCKGFVLCCLFQLVLCYELNKNDGLTVFLDKIGDRLNMKGQRKVRNKTHSQAFGLRTSVVPLTQVA